MILAGGTGGHVYPAVAVAKNLREKGAEIFWMGTTRGLEAKVVPGEGFHIDWLKVVGFRGKASLSQLRAPFVFIRACYQATAILLKRKPCVVLGMGGFVAAPGGLMAVMMRIPLVIHEQNRIPGTTNRLLAKIARVVLEAFPGSFDSGIEAGYSGNPLRKELLHHQNTQREYGSVPRILVLGGSQGAQILNQVLPKTLAVFGKPVEVLHQAGIHGLKDTENAYRNLGLKVQVTAFVDDMANAYNWADVIVCRAGAMTISELMAIGKPSILVPLPHAIDNHQMRNAEYLADAGGAIIIAQSDLSAELLATNLQRLVANQSRLEEMGKAARLLAKLDATDTVADICLRVRRT